MLPPTHRSPVLPYLLFPLVALTGGGCDRSPPISIAAEDFRFTPELVRIDTTSTLTLIVYNAGREVHEFDSSLLLYAARPARLDGIGGSGSSGVVIQPGKSIQFTVTPRPARISTRAGARVMPT